MQIRRAYKTELDPNDGQRRHLGQHAAATRRVWNEALALRKKLYRSDGLTVRAYTLNLLLTKWKRREVNAWLNDVSNSSLQEAFRELEAAYAHFFETCALLKAGDPATCNAKRDAKPRKDGMPFGFPRWRRRSDPAHFTVRGTIVVEARRIRLPKIGWVATKEREYLPLGRDCTAATISEHAGRWFVSFQIDEEHERGEATGDPVGVDLGLTDLACASDGRRWAGPKALAAAQRKLAHVQRKLARQKKGSGRWRDTKQQVARLHLQIGNVRGNALHELTSELVGVGLPPEQRPRVLVIEDLRVANMLGNGHLARHISDAAWAELRRQLTYKCEWWGVTLVVVNPAYTSQTCSACGCISADNREGKRFACSECGFSADADVNAAINIRERGLADLAGKAPERLNARGGHGKSSRSVAARGSVKRESARAAVAAGNDAGSVQGDCWRESVTQTVAPGATPGHSCATGGA